MLLNHPNAASIAHRLTSRKAPLAADFLSPLLQGIERLSTYRNCPDLGDADWLCLGVQRALYEVPSGRAFLQEVAAAQSPNPPDVGQFFQSLGSARRLRLVQEAFLALHARINPTLGDRWGNDPELADFELRAGDGHWHAAAAHDPRDLEGARSPCGHFYSLDLRTHSLHHIALADQVNRKQEHDMRALKRQQVERLRQGVAKGRKVLYAYDPAGIDFLQWEQWKRSGIYFLSLEKENMKLLPVKTLEWKRCDARNRGIIADEICQSSCGTKVRRVSYLDPTSGTLRVFITSEKTLPPGLIAEIYRRRWEIEKAFDQIKNKQGVKKAWASSPVAKQMQALFVCITHLLLLALDKRLQREEGVRPKREILRRCLRAAKERKEVEQLGLKITPLRAAQELTQRTVKFIRWLRAFFWVEAPREALIAKLAHSYASS